MSTKKFDTDLELQKNSGLSTPDSGYVIVAPKTDDNLYIKNSAGTEKRLLTTDDSSSYAHPTGFTDAPTSDLTGANVISMVKVNTEGHVTGVNTRSLTYSDIGAEPAIQVPAERLMGRISATDGVWEDIRIGNGLEFDVINNQLNVVGGSGSGTVTSVGLSMPNIFSVSGSPITTAGTLTATLVTQT